MGLEHEELSSSVIGAAIEVRPLGLCSQRLSHDFLASWLP